MYRYSAYGLPLHSQETIPGLAEGAPAFFRVPVEFSCREKPDWVIEAARKASRLIHTAPAGPGKADPAFALTEYGNQEFFQLFYSDGTQFLLDGTATKIWGECPPQLTLEDLATYLLGPVMGFVLRRRKVTPLHASAASVNGAAILLSGPAGAGKSTSAAALALRGTPILCDDICPLYEEEGKFSVLPGYPRVCLWPDSVEKLFGSSDALPRITPNWEKCFLALNGDKIRFERELRPLSVIYFLEPRSSQTPERRIEAMKPRDAIAKLVQNTYMNTLLSREQRAAEFDVLSRLAASVAFRRLISHSDNAGLDSLCDLILEDASKLIAERQEPATRRLT